MLNESVYIYSVYWTVASKTLWPEFEIINEDESEYSITDTDEHSESLITRQQIDESVNSIMENFEVWVHVYAFNSFIGACFLESFFMVSKQGDDDRQSWATFQEHIAKAPEQILR